MKAFERQTGAMMTWIDTAEGDENGISRSEYEQLVAVIGPSDEAGCEAFVITRPALQRLVRALAVALAHPGQ